MTTPALPPEPTPAPARAELTKYVAYLHQYCEKWYVRSVARLGIVFHGLAAIATLMAVSATLIAALADFKAASDIIKGALIVLPILSVGATSFLRDWRVRDWWQLREDGRIAFQDLVTEGRRRLAAAKTEEECSLIHEQLQAKALTVEQAQKLEFFKMPQPITAAAAKTPADKQLGPAVEKE